MPQSLEDLESRISVRYLPLPERKNGEDILSYLNAQLSRMGSRKKVTLLTGTILAEQRWDNRFVIPQTLTEQQIRVVLALASGPSVVEIGQLQQPVKQREYPYRDQPTYKASFIISVEHPVISDDGKRMLSWDIYDIHRDGQIVYCGPQA